ncbi:hypothetical protein NGF19_23395 [Streptomyces sp. RY43-2]|uniref:Uncharacterized protein n=1 Tax=Streptomyces macrolidinus TaxID=2952607 RepID=A0ABT0ZJF6_9ACTN|nr:hypothetical protein [Streptomyces macrolidinus]MCN9243696.1 hypothetical protein [Streptomyces macrolidinus]
MSTSRRIQAFLACTAVLAATVTTAAHAATATTPATATHAASGVVWGRPATTTVGTVSLPSSAALTAAAPAGSRQMSAGCNWWALPISTSMMGSIQARVMTA